MNTIIFDFPCSEIYRNFEAKMNEPRTRRVISTDRAWRPLNDEDLKDPKILRALETLKIISNAEELISYLNNPNEPEAKPIKKEIKKPEKSKGVKL